MTSTSTPQEIRADAIRRIVDAAPPLTPAQRATIGEVFRSARRGGDGR